MRVFILSHPWCSALNCLMLFGKRRAKYGAAKGNVLQPHVMSAVGRSKYVYTFLLTNAMNHEDGSKILLRNFGTYLLKGTVP